MTAPSQPFVCQIDSLGYKGEGISRPDGRAVFVPHALPTEQVEIKIRKVQKNMAFADLVRVLVPSKQRVQPVCPHFASCGGCAVQHMDAQLQQAFKRQAVQDNISRIARLTLHVQPTIASRELFHYRNKTTWQVKQDADGFYAGFYAAGTRDVVRVDHCYIASKPSNAAKDVVINWLNGCLHQGIKVAVHQFITRSNQAGELMLILHTSLSSLPRQGLLIQALKAAVPSLVSVCLSVDTDAEDDVRQTGNIKVLYGAPMLTETLMGIDFQVSPLSFFQVNHAVCESLYAHALQQAVRSPEDILLDLYAGAGTISLAAAQLCKQVVGVEFSEEAVKDARENARNNGIQNASFYPGKAEEVLPGLMATGLHADAVILDPPRKGAHPAVLMAIIKAQPQRVVYISCHPASQARDAAVLARAGYTATLAQPFDMFPQTAEIENVLTFERTAQ